MDDLDVGSIVSANFSIGRHPAIVLSTSEEIEATGNIFVVAISANTTLSLPEDRIPVPSKGLGIKKKCFAQCDVTETLPKDQVTSLNRKAWGVFLQRVVKQVRVATDRAKKSTQS